MELKESIYRTIAFFDLFDFPLTSEEIQKYLWGQKRPVRLKEIEQMLSELPGIEAIRDHYVLTGRGRLVETRRARKFIAEKLWTRTKFFGRYMTKVPFIRMIAVCNNLAYNNASETSDIDLFIVVKPGRLWLARFLVTVLLQFFGVRRHGDKIAGRFCLSFFVTDDALNLGTLNLKPEDPYLAYWVKTLAPVYGRKAYQYFQTLNRPWLREKAGLDFSADSEKHFFVNEKSIFKRVAQWCLSGWVGDAFEGILMRTLKKRTLQKARSLGPEAGVVVSDRMLKFHNHDRRSEYTQRWNERVRELMAIASLPQSSDNTQ